MSTSARTKAQISLEFFVLIGFMLMVFIAIVVIVQQRSLTLIQDNYERAQQDVADVLVRELRYAYIAGDGYQRSFTLPRTLQGLPYNVTLQTSPQAATLLITYRNNTVIRPVVVSVPYRVSKIGTDPANVVLRNSGGRVYLTLPAYLS